MAFLPVYCVNQLHIPLSGTQCFHSSMGTVNRYVRGYTFEGGMVLTTTNKEKFNKGLPHTNSPV